MDSHKDQINHLYDIIEKRDAKIKCLTSHGIEDMRFRINELEVVVQEQQELLNEASESLCGECNEIARIYVSDKICDYLEK